MKLNIQLFANGTIDGSSTVSGCDCKITWTSTGNTSTNSSSVTANIQIYRNGSSSTTGTFSGSITINGNKKSVSKKFSPYNWGNWATVGSYTVTVPHNSDGTKSITIKGSLTNTGTSMAGTYSASGTATLDTLHKAPIVNSWDFEETNSSLIGIGLSLNTYVKNLSRIKAEITNPTYYDDATFKKMNLYYETTDAEGYITYKKYLELSTNPAIFTPTLVTSEELELTVQLIDSLNAASEVGNSFGYYYNVIDYEFVTINGSAKRVGQTSGQVSINCNGLYFNGSIGNVNQGSSYKPTIKYKFWEYGTSEPSWSNAATISSSNISVDGNGNYSVSNLNIGSTNPSASNYFDYEKAYRIKIKVNDNFTEAETSELSIPVGKATWTEYKDRVDFAKLTIDNQPIIVTDYKSVYTGDTSAGGNNNKDITITKTGYKPIGIVGARVIGSRSSFVYLYQFYVTSDTTAKVYWRNTGTNALVTNNTAIEVYVAYIKE